MPEKLTSLAIVGVVALVVVGAITVGGIGNDLLRDAETSPADGSAPADSNGTGDASSKITVNDAGSSAWVEEDESLEPKITLTNDGERDRRQTVELKVDSDGDGAFDRTVAERDVTVPAGQTTQVSFTLDAPAPGEYQYGVVTDGKVGANWSVEVLQSPTFAVDETSVDAMPVRGEDATVSVRLSNDGDYRGEETVALRFGGQTVAERTVSIAGGDEATISMIVPTTDVDPGAHQYTVSIGDSTATGELQVLRSATFVVDELDGVLNVSRGANATIEATVTNEGEVAGNETVTLRGLGLGEVERPVSLAANETTVVEFRVPTDDLSAGTYAYSVATESDEAVATDGDDNGTSTVLEVRDGYFRVSEIRGNDTVLIGEGMSFAANVTNIGDATETQEIEIGIDLVGGSTPEKLGVTRNVTLDPGEETTIRFRLPAKSNVGMLDRLDELEIGSYIYGIYSEDTNQTSVFDARPNVRLRSTSEDGSADDDSSGDSSTTASPTATRDEISQAKYGRYYQELSAETRAQIDEIYQRQPFTNGLGVTDVLTREEIARQKYGLDVKSGDRFEFGEIERELQQQIEADFDAQFTSQSGDRIESLDELAQREYGEAYDQLTAEQQERIDRLYERQFT